VTLPDGVELYDGDGTRIRISIVNTPMNAEIETAVNFGNIIGGGNEVFDSLLCSSTVSRWPKKPRCCCGIWLRVITAGEIKAVDIELASLYFSPGFAEEEGLVIYGAEEEGGETLYQLPQGSYSFKRDEEGLHIDPVFPQDGWIRGLKLAVPLSLGFAAVLTLHDIFYPKSDAHVDQL